MEAEFKRYLFEYRHEGSEWGIEIVAESPHDARERLKALNLGSISGRNSSEGHHPERRPAIEVRKPITGNIRFSVIRIG